MMHTMPITYKHLPEYLAIVGISYRRNKYTTLSTLFMPTKYLNMDELYDY